jgi:hypothetical protein
MNTFKPPSSGSSYSSSYKKSNCKQKYICKKTKVSHKVVLNYFHKDQEMPLIVSNLLFQQQHLSSFNYIELGECGVVSEIFADQYFTVNKATTKDQITTDSVYLYIYKNIMSTYIFVLQLKIQYITVLLCDKQMQNRCDNRNMF